MVLEREAFEAIVSHAARAYPDECCGAIVGVLERERRLGHGAWPITNAATSPAHRFAVTPADYRQLEDRTRRAGRAVWLRSGARMAALFVRDYFGRGDGARGDHLLAPARRPIGLRQRGDHMATRILIPTPLRPFTGGKDTLELEGSTVGELLKALVAQHGDLKRHLYSDEGKLRSFVNIYLNDDDIRHLEKEQTPVRQGDTISIVPSVAGGSATIEQDAPELSREEIQRYSRHLIMPEVGMDGQRKLKAARVVCIGRSFTAFRTWAAASSRSRGNGFAR